MVPEMEEEKEKEEELLLSKCCRVEYKPSSNSKEQFDHQHAA